MNNSEIIRNAKQEDASAPFNKRVILSMGGKGGVGKTSIMAGFAEWFDAIQIPVQLLDIDITEHLGQDRDEADVTVRLYMKRGVGNFGVLTVASPILLSAQPR